MTTLAFENWEDKFDNETIQPQSLWRVLSWISADFLGDGDRTKLRRSNWYLTEEEAMEDVEIIEKMKDDAGIISILEYKIEGEIV